MSDTSDDEDVGVLIAAKDVAFKPFRLAASRPARRLYLTTALFFGTSLVLLVTASLAYIIFYYSYIPNRGFTRAVHLQFGPSNIHAPYGTASLDRQIKSEQPYDVSVILHMPRTPANKAAGNFMLDLRLFGPAGPAPPTIPGTFPAEAQEVLAHSRRPTILTYYSETLEHARRVAGLLWYVLGLRQEAETLEVPMLEGAEFARGWRNVPATARLEVHSDAALQVYSAHLRFTARLRGLRYLMYNHRLTAFVALTLAFWAVEMAVAAGVWLVLAFVVFPAGRRGAVAVKAEPEHGESGAGIKREPASDDDGEGAVSDTPRTYPSTSRSHPVMYTPPSIKREEGAFSPPLAEIPPLGAEADDEDDEDEDADFVLDEPLKRSAAGSSAGGHRVSDSGIGTSLDSGGDRRRESMRRRRARTMVEQWRQRGRRAAKDDDEFESD